MKWNVEETLFRKIKTKIVQNRINCDNLHVIAKFEKWIVFNNTKSDVFAENENLSFDKN